MIHEVSPEPPESVSVDKEEANKDKNLNEINYFNSKSQFVERIDADNDPFQLFGNGLNVFKAFMGDLTWMLFLVTLASLPIIVIYRS